MAFEIEKGIPIPENAGRGYCRYPFKEMSVGDSFALGIDNLNSVKVLASKYSKADDKKFSVHKVEGGYRCWRVS